MAKMLDAVGIPCGHEKIFSLAINTNLILCDDSAYLAESSWLAVPFLNSVLLEDTPIIHIVRDPLDVISSYLSNKIYLIKKSPYWIYQAAFEPWMYDEKVTALEMACAHYWYWNDRIESYKDRTYFFHRIEDDAEEFLNNLGHSVIDDKVSPGYNHVKDIAHRVTWEEIMNCQMQDEQLKERLIEMTKRYGYDACDKYNFANVTP